MLKRQFNPQQPHRVVLYLRMSSDRQNPRSPDQQEAEIKQRIQALGHPWKIVNIYRDDGESGRYVRKRHGFQKMLQDIRSGAVVVDLILVDTFERFGRNDELLALRKELQNQHGVLLLTADSHFADPTTPQGQAFGAFEAMRATEENRVKSHQVLRGKRDKARQGFWPGGKPPFGYRLVSQMSERDGRQFLEGSKLEPHPEEAMIITTLFELADQTGFGPDRLARLLNRNDDIPARYKPFHPSTVRYWLEQEIYKGDLAWEKQATDIVDDARVIEAIPRTNGSACRTSAHRSFPANCGIVWPRSD
ncbi:recombinase family protein [Thalassoroseus pseudoceratinae]|uniref:recombinase family protein n=1 Tax=Thalassoroseus pseudoceratinae TaxID=2713176 RepID=UPI00141ED7AD|nr:recombinase family protein [Thalassoroseus pseudoceratinae]